MEVAELVIHYSSRAFQTRIYALTFSGVAVGAGIAWLSQPVFQNLLGLTLLAIVASLAELNRRYTYGFSCACRAVERAHSGKSRAHEAWSEFVVMNDGPWSNANGRFFTLKRARLSRFLLTWSTYLPGLVVGFVLTWQPGLWYARVVGGVFSLSLLTWWIVQSLRRVIPESYLPEPAADLEADSTDPQPPPDPAVVEPPLPEAAGGRSIPRWMLVLSVPGALVAVLTLGFLTSRFLAEREADALARAFQAKIKDISARGHRTEPLWNLLWDLRQTDPGNLRDKVTAIGDRASDQIDQLFDFTTFDSGREMADSEATLIAIMEILTDTLAIDKIRAVAETMPQWYLRLGRAYARLTDYTKWRAVAAQALRISADLSDSSYIAAAYQARAACEIYGFANYQTAGNLLDSSAAYFTGALQDRASTTIYGDYLRALVSLKLGQHGESRRWADSMLAHLAPAPAQHFWRAKGLGLIAILHRINARFDSSSAALEAALHSVDAWYGEDKPSELRGDLLDELGQTLELRGDHSADSLRWWTAALGQYRLSLELSKQTAKRRGIAYESFRVGRIQRKLGDLKQSLNNLESALRIYKSIDSLERFVVYTYDQLGQTYAASGQNARSAAMYDSAAAYLSPGVFGQGAAATNDYTEWRARLEQARAAVLSRM